MLIRQQKFCEAASGPQHWGTQGQQGMSLTLAAVTGRATLSHCTAEGIGGNCSKRHSPGICSRVQGAADTCTPNASTLEQAGTTRLTGQQEGTVRTTGQWWAVWVGENASLYPDLGAGCSQEVVLGAGLLLTGV